MTTYFSRNSINNINTINTINNEETIYYNENNIPIAIPISSTTDEYSDGNHNQYSNEPILVGQVVKPPYSTFVNRVLVYVFLQLIFTSGMAITGYIYKEPLISFIAANPQYIYISLGIFVISTIAMVCSRKSNVCLYIFFILFTISSASLITVSILPYSPVIVLQAVTGTTVAVSCVNIYAFWCSQNNIDLIEWNKALLFASLGLIPIIMIEMLLSYNSPLMILVSVIIVVLFTLYLLYDLNQLYNGNSEQFYDNPILVAVTIYLDIMNIFLYMLQILGICESDNN